MCSVLPLEAYRFSAPYLSFNPAQFVFFIVLAGLVFAILHARIALWIRVVIAVVFVATLMLFVMMFSSSLCGAPSPMLPLSYHSGAENSIVLEQGQAVRFEVGLGATRFDPIGVVVWEGTASMPVCGTAECTLPEQGIIYRCDAFGVHALSIEESRSLAANASVSDVPRFDPPCELELVGVRQVEYQQLMQAIMR